MPSFEELLREWEILSRVIDYHWREFQSRLPNIPSYVTSFTSVFLVGGLQLVQRTLESGQTMTALPIAKWWEYAALPVSGCFMVIFLVEQLVEVILTPAGPKGDGPANHDPGREVAR